MKYCSYCGKDKPYDSNAKRHSKASKFFGLRCWDCWLIANSTAVSKNLAAPGGRAKHNALNRITSLAWQKKNPGKCNALSMAYRATKLQRTRSWTQYPQIIELYEKAAELARTTGLNYHVDHGIPLRGSTASGLHVLENLRILPGPENCSKGNRRDLEWERSLGYHVE